MPERGPGRPPVDSKENRLNKLLDGVSSLLHQGDYGALTVDAIARSAGMAKKTVYTLVKSKEELITGVILREVSTLDLLLDGDVSTEAQMLAELQKFLSAWARLALRPVGLGIYFMAIANRDTTPAIAEILERQGLSHAVKVLRNWLEKPSVLKFFDIEDMQEALDLVSSILITRPTWRVTLRPGGQLDEVEIDEVVATTIKIFVRCYLRKNYTL